MKKFFTTIVICLLSVALQAEDAPLRDWANFGRYAAQNDSLRRAGAEIQVVFLGNSITQGWREKRPQFFTDHPFVGRGISGQTSSEILVRMRQDVIGLHPKVVVILAGTNDLAQNNGPITPEHVLGNIISMCELARANGIEPVLCSLLPARAFYWTKRVTDVPARVQNLNALIRSYADANGITYVDYWSAMVDAQGGMRDELTGDGVHPNVAGYEVMEPIVLRALAPMLNE